ncbi:molybdopterin-dependent oxidoreductase [Acidimicrobiaceae bacterium USS-CC1]|uniref:Molybdopterin-dependent oxidoreductase n=1 Tax=Acidiferrimicrobium australe TaxID=2664430 RepID=A0ABW9QQ54_9ACTN|nr:molybdopterin-dependent oxidoreductase [Acidiferrimicrobium australe]
MSLIGARVVRKEDPALLTGQGAFVDDLAPTGCAFMAMVPSSEAHARIVSIGTEEARRAPGVLAVWTAADVADLPLVPGPPGLQRPLLAAGTVRYLGEPVAVVVANDRYQASSAAALVVVDYEPLPVAANVAAAMAAGAPLVNPDLPSNVVFEQGLGDEGLAELEACPHRATLRISIPKCAPSPIEPTGCLADWGPTGLTEWVPFQAPHHLRTMLSRFFGVSQDQTRVILPEIGGGFGSKINFVPELFLAPALSRFLQRPVKYIQTRSEAMQSMYHGRGQEQEVEVGFDDDGRILVLRAMVTQDNGAYPNETGMGLPVLTTTMAAGCYHIPKVVTGWRNVLTHTTPVAAYRGAGRPEAAFLIERTIDLVADELGLDPVEVRRRNVIRTFPYATHSPLAVYDSGDYAGALDELMRIMDYEGLRAEQERRRSDPDAPLLGIGFSSWLEIAGFGPPGSLEGFGHLGSWESVQVRIQPDGSAIVYTGAAPHGQGTVTTFAQIAASELGIPFDKVSVRYGDTAVVPQGIGTMGSRITPIGGEGVRTASGKVVERAKRIAAHLLEAAPEDVVLAEDGFAVQGTPSRTIAWSEVAWKSFQPLEIPSDLEPGALDATVFQQVSNFSFPSGAYGCVVEIDRQTGRVEIRRMYLVDDCGTVINPMLAEGQVHGGVAQGVAQALYEQVVYDDAGTMLTGTFMDYLVPSAVEIPPFTDSFVCTPSTSNTLGAKGIGESGSVGAPPAVVNAVVDALSPLGVRHVDMPVTPEKVWRILRDGTATPV